MKRGKMEKIKVKLEINGYTIKDIGILDNSIIFIKEKDISLTYDIKNNILTRENKEMKQTINYKEECFKYLLKDIKKEFSQKFKVLSLTNKDKKVNIIYQIEDSVFNLNLKYETKDQNNI